MMRSSLLFDKTQFSVLTCFIFLFFQATFSQEKIVTVKGFAPSYVGMEIAIYETEDYWSMRQSKMATATVQADSSFKLQFFSDETRKVTLRAKNNYAWLYIEPNKEYSVFVPENNPMDPVVKSGNQIELSFLELDKNDVNYKILSLQRWSDEFLMRHLHLKSTQPQIFANKLDTFKINVEKAYKEDSSIFFLTFAKFTMAGLDEIEYAASRNRYEKYDFYIKPSPVFYQNDLYTSYIKQYYKNMIPRLSNQTNNDVYLAVLKSSPTLVMKALGSEYSLENLRLREIVMMSALSEVFYSDDFPQTNILTIFDSLANRSLFKENSLIARNLTIRLTELVSGAKAPEFVLTSSDGVVKTHLNFRGKYLYIHFYDPKSLSNKREMVLLKEMYAKYINEVEFLTIVLDDDNLTDTEIRELNSIQWPIYRKSAKDDFMSKFKVQKFPTYFLIDAFGYLVQSPALSPTPNAQYETIDKTFFAIQKALREKRER